MIKNSIKQSPKSLNIDFEKAVMNAGKIVFDDCAIYGCFFHLSKFFFRRVQKNLLPDFKKDPTFRKSYKLMQAIAYLPEEDVISGFNYLVKQSKPDFEPMLVYFKKNYIGNLKVV